MAKREQRTVREVALGEYAEGMPWRIVADVEVASGLGISADCPHVIERDGGRYLRLAVEADNEGGHNGTQVCAECLRLNLLEARAAEGLVEDEQGRAVVEAELQGDAAGLLYLLGATGDRVQALAESGAEQAKQIRKDRSYGTAERHKLQKRLDELERYVDDLRKASGLGTAGNTLQGLGDRLYRLEIQAAEVGQLAASVSERLRGEGRYSYVSPSDALTDLLALWEYKGYEDPYEYLRSAYGTLEQEADSGPAHAEREQVLLALAGLVLADRLRIAAEDYED